MVFSLVQMFLSSANCQISNWLSLMLWVETENGQAYLLCLNLIY